MDSPSSGRASAYPSAGPPRRKPLILMAVGAFVFFAIFFSTTSSVAQVSQTVAHGAASVSNFSPFHIPSGRFRSGSDADGSSTRAHDPPGRERNSSSGDTHWYNHWNWRHPFSASVSHDEAQAVLPPLAARPPVYTYYDAGAAKEPAVRDAERELLLIWRRAWWAQGFRPVILGRAEAMRNPHYETLQALHLQPAMQQELLRWLAWGHMGPGVLANWLVLPMAARDDHDLAFLRRGLYPALTRYEAFGAGLFCGPAEAVDKLIGALLASSHAADYQTFLDAAAEHPDAFAVDAKPPGIAFYELPTLNVLYPDVAETVRADRPTGLADLARLVTSHLHGTFLTSHPGGLEVLNLHNTHAALIAAPATALAAALNTCPSTPVPASSPPNRQAPLPGTQGVPGRIAYTDALANRTDALQLVTVPHPYTLSLLLRSRPALDVASVRRSSERDAWLTHATSKLHGDKIGAYERVVRLKDAIAGPQPRSALWRTAERPWEWRELEWHFGFVLPRPADAPPTLRIEERPSPVADPPMLAPLLGAVSPRPVARALALQWDLKAEAEKVLQSGGRTRGGVNMKEVVEAWHLADAEAWRFVRALEEREKVEREVWEKEEAKVSGLTVVEKG